MHILPAIQRESRYLMPLLAIILLGLSLVFVTWQNLRQQRQAVEQHMVLAARALAMGIEGNMSWRMRSPTRMGMSMHSAKQFLQELLTSPELVFVGLIGPSGQVMLSSEEPETFPTIPHTAMEDLQKDRQWHGFSHHQGQEILLYVLQLRQPAVRHMHDNFLPRGHVARGHPSYLVLGLDMNEHLVMYHDARRAALWQGGYVLATVALLWLGAVKLIQRREQTAKVRELEHFQSRLLDNLPDGLLTIDADGVIRGANPMAVALLANDAPLPGRRWADLPLKQQTGQIAAQNSLNILWSQYTHADRHLEILVVPLHVDSKGLGERLALVRDRTEIKKLENSLQESERLAAIGRLAAAVAHEIRNPLSALRGFAQFFLGKLAGREPEQTYARTMVAEADRLNRVITDLLFLAKPKPPQKQAVSLPDLLENLEPLFRSETDRHRIELHTNFSIKEVQADPDLLKQCLLNLLINALQAITDRGEDLKGRIAVNAEPGQGGTWIVVEDNGKGMNAQQQKHALEPFYTTHKEGSGLGLAIVHKIVRDHEGRLEMASEPGQGTRVSMFFPHDREPRTMQTPPSDTA